MTYGEHSILATIVTITVAFLLSSYFKWRGKMLVVEITTIPRAFIVQDRTASDGKETELPKSLPTMVSTLGQLSLFH